MKEKYLKNLAGEIRQRLVVKIAPWFSKKPQNIWQIFYFLNLLTASKKITWYYTKENQSQVALYS